MCFLRAQGYGRGYGQGRGYGRGRGRYGDRSYGSYGYRKGLGLGSRVVEGQSLETRRLVNLDPSVCSFSYSFLAER